MNPEPQVPVHPFARLAAAQLGVTVAAGVALAMIAPRFALLAAALIFGWTQLGTL